MNNPEKAVACFEKGMNCAQSILSVYGPPLGLHEETCVRLASAFGGGIAHTQEVCGAVTGGIMVLGLKHGEGTAERDGRDRVNALAQDFIARFRKRNSAILCRDLLGADITTGSGLLDARARGLFSACGGYIRIAAELLETML